MSTDSVMLMLRDGTAELHSIAERQPFQRALIRGELSAAQYASYLGQMLLIHAALEAGLAGCPDTALRGIVTGDQFQAANLRADLQALGTCGSTPSAATGELIAAITQNADAASLLGFLYV